MSIERVFVAGAGLMGHGIAQVHAAVGKEVTLYEPDLARAEAGRARIAGNLERAVAKGKLTADEREAILARLTGTADLGHAADADLVVEAVFEDVDVKTGSGPPSTRSRRRTRSSPRTPRRSPSTGSPRRSAERARRGSSACTSSARCP